MLLGHGLVFRDFSFALDPGAVVTMLRMGIPITLVPYDAARGLTLTGTDLASMAARDGTAA